MGNKQSREPETRHKKDTAGMTAGQTTAETLSDSHGDSSEKLNESHTGKATAMNNGDKEALTEEYLPSSDTLDDELETMDETATVDQDSNAPVLIAQHSIDLIAWRIQDEGP
jgi:hypothetical protein